MRRLAKTSAVLAVLTLLAMLLVPAAFLFIGGMFASGIVTALIVYRRSY